MARPGPRTLSCGLIVAMLFLALPGQAAASPCAVASARPSAASLSVAAGATVCLVNRIRARRRLRAFRSIGRLALAARRHSRDMVRRRFFSHWSPGGASPLRRIRRAGYLRGARGYLVGENIGWGARGLATPNAIVRHWMRSPPHRAALLSRRFREIGLGVAVGSPRSRTVGAGTYTATFGRRR